MKRYLLTAALAGSLSLTVLAPVAATAASAPKMTRPAHTAPQHPQPHPKMTSDGTSWA